MHKCFKCGIEFEGNFCPECGEKYLEEKICPKCGEKLDGSAKFCNSCGYSFIGDSYNHNKEKAPEKMEKLYNFITSFPSILFMILSVALMLLFLLPVAIMPGGEIMGEKIPSESYGNVYQLSNFDDTPFKGTLTILMVFGIIGLFIALIISLSNVFYKFKYKHITIANKKIFIKDIFTGLGYIIFFIIFILSCTLLGQISSFDEGMGVISGGLSPILTLVLTLISILLYGGSLFFKYYLIKKYPSLKDTIQDKINDSKPTKVETWLTHHKKIMAISSGILVIAIVVSIIVPTILANVHNGVYYEYNAETELYNKEKYYRLKGESWEDEEGNQGSIIFDGEDVTLSFELFGEKMELEGTLIRDVLNVNNTIYAKEDHGHSFGNWEVIEKGTCIQKETEAHYCICGKKETREGDKYGDHAFTVDKEATCADWGVEGEYCSLCGKLGENAHYIDALHVKYEKQLSYGWSVSVVIGLSKECNHAEIVIPSLYPYKNELCRVSSIGDNAFNGCTSLTSIAIPDSVTSIGDEAFKGCSSLTDVTIPNGVTSIGIESFANCTALKSIIIPSSVESIESKAFNGCTSLEYIDISDNVTFISDDAFMDTAYYNDEKNRDEQGVLYIGNHLIDAKSSISGSYSIKDGTKTISPNAFNQCTSLTSITIPDGVTSIGETTFKGCTSLTNITIPDSVTSIGDSAFEGCTSLTSITIPNSVTSIERSAFSGCTSLTSIVIPNSVTIIEDWTFLGCTSLTNITIPNSVAFIGDDAFYGCTSLTNITIPDSVTSIGSFAFYGCTSLTSITIPNSVTSIKRSAFEDCSSLISIEIPNSVLSIGTWAFSGCTSLTSITIPNSVTSIEYSAFSGCTSLTNITIPNSVAFIGGAVFDGCSALTSIKIPDGITSIGDSAFFGCKSLNSIDIPDGVTSIGGLAFYGCTSLTSIIIPSSVTTIGNLAFRSCSKLTIFCEIEENAKPDGWKSQWNYNSRPVYWKDQWSLVDGVPTPNE